MATRNESPNPNSTEAWTVVSRRRRRSLKQQQPKRSVLPGPETLIAPPSPWIPIDSFVDLERRSKLLQRMESAIRRLECSSFYRRFLLRLRGHLVQHGLARALSSALEIRMVVYGVGSIESYDPSRLQLALAILLRRDLGLAVPYLEVFDPILSATECAVMTAFDCALVPVDERGRREVRAPTLFYMPHCEAALYDGLLEANWRPSSLNRMVVLGNSFSAYEQFVELGSCSGSASVEAAVKHLLLVRRHVTEVEMEEEEAGAGSQGKQDDEDGIFKAFHDTSWHFFDLDDDKPMDLVKR
ncbi:protein SENSITIVITY TO RED LIGHT REDUCED 1-like [Musa acuminata AAA Group]|uniref:protein SENSITIVITY TO RED LIGHT REDUCED 1-like n=1 Tax=Musa acuminata AAA Group TaxID=214697 RepID=UPI0031CE428B